MAIRRRIAEFLTKLNGRNARVCKTYHPIDGIYFVKRICKEKHLFIS